MLAARGQERFLSSLSEVDRRSGNPVIGKNGLPATLRGPF